MSYTDTERLNALLMHAFEIVCKIPGGIQCVETREHIDSVIECYEARARAATDAARKGE